MLLSTEYDILSQCFQPQNNRQEHPPLFYQCIIFHTNISIHVTYLFYPLSTLIFFFVLFTNYYYYYYCYDWLYIVVIIFLFSNNLHKVNVNTMFIMWLQFDSSYLCPFLSYFQHCPLLSALPCVFFYTGVTLIHKVHIALGTVRCLLSFVWRIFKCASFRVFLPEVMWYGLVSKRCLVVTSSLQLFTGSDVRGPHLTVRLGSVNCC